MYLIDAEGSGREDLYAYPVDTFRSLLAPVPCGYEPGFARTRGSSPAAAIDSLYEQMDRVRELLDHGTYVELPHGYLVRSDSFLPEAPKLYVFEDAMGLHIQGRGDGASEEGWLDITFNGAHYHARDKSYVVTEGRAMDASSLRVMRDEDDRLHITVSSGMLMPPEDLAFERAGA